MISSYLLRLAEAAKASTSPKRAEARREGHTNLLRGRIVHPSLRIQPATDVGANTTLPHANSQTLRVVLARRQDTLTRCAGRN